MKKETTGARLRLLMNERKLKQVDIINLATPFCAQYNVKLNKSDLSQYISDKFEPSQEKLVILGMALNVSEAWLMGFDVPRERRSDSSAPKGGTNNFSQQDIERALRFIEKYDNAIPQVQNAVRSLLELSQPNP